MYKYIDIYIYMDGRPFKRWASSHPVPSSPGVASDLLLVRMYACMYVCNYTCWCAPPRTQCPRRKPAHPSAPVGFIPSRAFAPFFL